MPDPTHATEESVPIILARMEVKLDNSLATQDRHDQTLHTNGTRIDSLESRMDRLETKHDSEDVHTRVTALEKRMWAWVGASAVLSSLLVTYGPRLIGA